MFRHFISNVCPSSTKVVVVNSSTLRFCSSSNNNSNNNQILISRLKNLALCVIPPSGTWMKISDVARQLPDDFFDELPDDIAGLRGLLELCDPATEAVITFRTSNNGGAGPLEVSRQMPNNNKNIPQVRNVLDAPPVPVDFSIPSSSSSSSNNKTKKIFNSEVNQTGTSSIPEEQEITRLQRIAQAERIQKEASAAAKEKRRQKHEEILRIARERAESAKMTKSSQVAAAAAGAPMPKLADIKQAIAVDEVEVERAQVRSLTSFPIPLIEAANDHYKKTISNNAHEEENNNNNSANMTEESSSSSSSTTPEEIVKRVSDLLAWIEPAKHMIDLFHTSKDPWQTLRERISSSSSFDDFYISILPPFRASHGPLDGETKFADFKAHEYDLYRLARFLSTTFFVTIKSLLDSDVQDILQKPLLQVIASFPYHFEFIPPGAPVPEIEERQPSTVEQVVKGADALGLPIVKVGVNKNISDEELSINNNRDEDFGYVRYILPLDQFSTATRCSFTYKNATLEELEKALQVIKKSAKHSTPPDDTTPEDLGILKAYPVGPRRQSMKQEVTRALNLRRFPRGNVFFDRNVVAHYIFDTIPADEAIPFEKYKSEFLGNRCRNCAPMYGNFPTLYPHLFHAFQDDRGDWFLQRADSTHLVKVKSVAEITIDEVLLGIMASKPKRIDPMRPFQAATCMYKMTKIVQKACRQKFGGINNVIRSNPQRFTVLLDETTINNNNSNGHKGGRYDPSLGSLFFFNEEITQQVCDRFGFRKKDDGTFEFSKDAKKTPTIVTEEEENAVPVLKETPPAPPPEGKNSTKKPPAENNQQQQKIPDGENLWDHFANKKENDDEKK